jgi:hypothetical protein
MSHNNLTSVESNNTFRSTSGFNARLALAKIKCSYCGCWKARGISSCKLCGTAGKQITDLKAVAKSMHLKNKQLRQHSTANTNSSSTKRENENDLSFGERIFHNNNNNNNNNVKSNKIGQDQLQDDFNFLDHQLAQQENMFFSFVDGGDATKRNLLHQVDSESKNRNQSCSPTNSCAVVSFAKNSVATTTTTKKSCKTHGSSTSSSSMFKIEKIVDTFSDKNTHKNHKFR